MRPGCTARGVQLGAVELDPHLGLDEAERLEQHAHEVVEHSVGHLARDEPRREVPEQPRLALATRRARPLLRRAADEDAHDEGHGEEDERGQDLLGAVEAQLGTAGAP